MSTPSRPGGGRLRKGSYQPAPSSSTPSIGRAAGKGSRRASIAVASQTTAPEGSVRTEDDDHVPELVALTPKIHPAADEVAGSASASSSSSVRPALTKTRSRGKSITAVNPTTPNNPDSPSPNMISVLSPPSGPPMLPMYAADTRLSSSLSPNNHIRRARAPSLLQMPPASMSADAPGNALDMIGLAGAPMSTISRQEASRRPSVSRGASYVNPYPSVGGSMGPPPRTTTPRAGLTRRISSSNLVKDSIAKPAFGLGPRPVVNVNIPEGYQRVPSSEASGAEQSTGASAYPPTSVSSTQQEPTGVPRRTTPSAAFSQTDGGDALVHPATASAVGGVLSNFWLAGRGLAEYVGAIRPHEEATQGNKRRRLSDEQPSSTESYFSQPESVYAPGAAGSLPTPALSAVSLSAGQHADSQSWQVRRQLTPISTSRPARGRSFKSFVFGSSAGQPSDKDRMSPVPGSSPEIGRQWPEGSSALGADGLHAQETVPLQTAWNETIKGLGWVLGVVGVCFLVSLGIVAGLLMSLPISSLRSLPKQVSDLQVLSAEIRSYMASSPAGWWHTIGVLMFVGMWKHSWSVPGAVVLNILVGTLLQPLQALFLLTVITSFGSFGSYLLSRPLAPLIAFAFPKPLAMVRNALNPEDELENKDASVWRRLLVMRAMGVVPWSGMNVACGVVGVDVLTFLLTTAAGSASWSYVTASVGNIISRLALPSDAAVSAVTAAGDAVSGQSLTSLLRDPALILKLVVLSALSLLPVLFKSHSRSSALTSAPPPTDDTYEMTVPLLSPSTAAKTPIAPTPSIYAVSAVLMSLTRKGFRTAETVWRAAAATVKGTLEDAAGAPLSAGQ